MQFHEPLAASFTMRGLKPVPAVMKRKAELIKENKVSEYELNNYSGQLTYTLREDGKKYRFTIADTQMFWYDVHEKVEEIKAKIVSGELKVFDTATFTVEGKTLTEYMADVDSDANFTPDTNVVSDGYFHESEMRSAPYFDVIIDGITEK